MKDGGGNDPINTNSESIQVHWEIIILLIIAMCSIAALIIYACRENKPKQEEEHTMMTFLYIISLIGIFIFTAVLPILWWEIGWRQLLTIVFNKDQDAQMANELTKIMQAFGLTDKTLHSWAFERILICLGIMIVLVTFASVVYYKLKHKTIKENENLKESTNTQVIINKESPSYKMYKKLPNDESKDDQGEQT